MDFNRLISKSFGARKKYIVENRLEAYRLFTQEEVGFPLAVDVYANNAVVQLFAPLELHEKKALELALSKELHTQNFFYKNRMKEEQNAGDKQEKNTRQNTQIIINEYGHQFLINLSDYLDTGIFLDHRETRRWLKSQSQGKTVLNTFAYTGSFSVYAAAGGAKKTYSVDLSGTYCGWIKENLKLNRLPSEKNWVCKMDTFEFFKYARKKCLRFDIIILDPPTFSRNKGKSFSVQKDHPRLINEALDLLHPGGFILFSNNCREFLLERAKISPCQIQEKTDLLPPDFQGSFAHWCFLIQKPPV